MPIYEYACKRCEHRFDVLQKMSDEVLVDCPECGEAALRKLLSAPKFRLKGKGWYETDFKTGEKRNNIAGDSDGKEKSPDVKPNDASKSVKKADKKEAKKSSATDSKVKSAGGL